MSIKKKFSVKTPIRRRTYRRPINQQVSSHLAILGPRVFPQKCERTPRITSNTILSKRELKNDRHALSESGNYDRRNLISPLSSPYTGCCIHSQRTRIVVVVDVVIKFIFHRLAEDQQVPVVVCRLYSFESTWYTCIYLCVCVCLCRRRAQKMAIIINNLADSDVTIVQWGLRSRGKRPR